MRYYFTIVLILISMFQSTAQDDETMVDSLLDEFLSADNQIIDDLLLSLSNFNLIYASTTYNTKTYFSGRDIGIDQYNISTQLTYANSNGFYTGISGTYFSQFYPKWDVTTLYIGFGNYLNKQKTLSYNTAYSRYFYANSEDNIFANTLDFGLGIRTKNKILATQLTGSYLFGKESSFHFLSKTYFKTNLLKEKNTLITIKPQLNILFGKQTIELSRIDIIENIPETTYSKNTVFDLINTQLIFPVECTFNNFDICFGYTFNFPHPIGEEVSLKTTSFFNFSLGYLLEL